jgi:hypothetical protein
VTNDRRASRSALPRHWKRILGELVTVRDVEGRGQRRLFAELVRSNDLGDFHNLGLVGLQIRDCDHAVARAKINAETESSVHGMSLCLPCARDPEITAWAGMILRAIWFHLGGGPALATTALGNGSSRP